MKQKIAIDVGSGFTQYRTDNDKEGSFPSIVCSKPTEEDFGMEGTLDIVQIEKESFLIGKDAFSYGDPGCRYDTLSEEWAGTIAWKALLYSAIACCEPKYGSQIDLITGLPQLIYVKTKATIKKLLEGQHEFVFQEKHFKVDINPVVVPQAAAALFSKVQEDPAMMQDMIGVIDIGTYTTGFSVVVENRFVTYKSSGCAIGVSQIFDALSKFLVQEKNFSIDPALLPKILMEKKYRYQREDVNIDMEIEKLCMQVAKPMLDSLNQYWQGGKELLVFIAGGGAEYFYEPIKTMIPHAQLMDDAYYAVVRGLYSILNE